MPKTPRAPRVKVVVDKEMIESGIRRDSAHCVISEAVKVAYPDASRVSTDLQTIRFTDPKKGLRFTYLTPRIAQVSLVNYDQGHEPEPFEFSLKGGQVTLSGKRVVQEGLPKKPATDAQKRQRRAAARKARLSRAKLVDRKESPGNVPDRVGGSTPPVVPGGSRRAFGIRGFDR